MENDRCALVRRGRVSGRNLYGCLPCPRCDAEFRWPTQVVHPEHPQSIICDDCGLVEGPWVIGADGYSYDVVGGESIEGGNNGKD